jgi:hypothetical protein
LKGAGYEKNYQNCEIKFMNIHNIHVMRKSFLSVMDLCETLGYDINFLSKLESTNWLEHIRNLLASSTFIVKAIEEENTSILLHCSGIKI